ncbi:CopG family ribbon-helix-helix protein [Terasakiella pusilla]|uniref:CopG family ribbon-helix-helix protein n=1 Tax=Terasakiella pusilla TaxID=64973 RepID=UPI003AA8942E
MVTTVGLKLEEETKERLQKLGKDKDRSTHWMMKRAITEYLEREESYEQEKHEDLARWAKFQETGECVSNKDMGTFFDGLTAKAQAAQK